MEDTNVFHREQLLQEGVIFPSACIYSNTHIVGCIRVIIDAAKKRCCRIFAYLLDQQIGPPGVLINEVRDIMKKASDNNQRSATPKLLP
jgi:hypothetical protein